jgi:hypothetical protein
MYDEMKSKTLQHFVFGVAAQQLRAKDLAIKRSHPLKILREQDGANCMGGHCGNPD